MKNKIIESPNSKETEMMVLGCMFNNEDSFNISVNSIVDQDFFYREHKILFKAFKEAYKENKPADVHLIAEKLKQQSKLEEIGGISYLIELAQYAGTSASIEEYIDILKDYSTKRKLLDISCELQHQLNEQTDSNKIIQQILETLQRNNEHKINKEKLHFLDEFDENYLFKEPPKKQMLLEYINERGTQQGFLPKGIVAMLVGAGGSGKSHLLSQLTLAIATGIPFLNNFIYHKKGNVFIGLGENQYEDIHRLLYKSAKNLRNQNTETSKELLLEARKRIAVFSFCGQQAAFIVDKKPSLYFRRLKWQLINSEPKDGWDLIILDPISRLLGADAEIDNSSATQFIALLEELTIDLSGNPTVLFAHHVNKTAIREKSDQTQSAARGSSALTDGVRWQANLTQQASKEPDITDISILKITKSNFTAIHEAIFLQKDYEGFIEPFNEDKTKEEPENESLFK